MNGRIIQSELPTCLLEMTSRLQLKDFCAGIPGSYLFWSQPLNKWEVLRVSKAKHPVPFLIHKLFSLTSQTFS